MLQDSTFNNLLSISKNSHRHSVRVDLLVTNRLVFLQIRMSRLLSAVSLLGSPAGLLSSLYLSKVFLSLFYKHCSGFLTVLIRKNREKSVYSTLSTTGSLWSFFNLEALFDSFHILCLVFFFLLNHCNNFLCLSLSCYLNPWCAIPNTCCLGWLCFVFYWNLLFFSNVTLAFPSGSGCRNFPKHCYVFAFAWHSVSTTNPKTNYFVNVFGSDWGPFRMPNPSLGQTEGSDFIWHLGYHGFFVFNRSLREHNYFTILC